MLHNVNAIMRTEKYDMHLKNFTSKGKRYSLEDVENWPEDVLAEAHVCWEWSRTNPSEMAVCNQPECRSEGIRRYVGSTLRGFACRACRERIERRQRDNTNAPRRPSGSNDVYAVDEMHNLLPYLSKNTSVVDGGCHEWLGRKVRGGYGILHLRAGRSVLAHRAVLLSKGATIGQNFVLHSCDNPSCVNPEHLRVGTAKDNMADMLERNRRSSENLGKHLTDRTKHPKARPVRTPAGDFPSAALAAEHHGYSRAHGALLAKSGKSGWTYLD